MLSSLFPVRKVSLFVAFVIIATSIFAFPAIASSESTGNTPSAADISADVASLWTINKASNNVNAISAAESYLGDPIIAYRTTAAGLEKCEVVYYPIIENGQVSAIASLPLDYPDCINVGVNFAPDINAFFSGDPIGKALALIYDGSKLYAYDGTNCGIIHTYGEAGYKEYGNVAEKVQALVSDVAVIGSQNQVALVSGPMPRDGRTLAIPVVRQGQKNLCWACCVSSITEYKTGKSYSPSKIASDYGVSEDSGLEARFVPGSFSKYGVSATFYNSAPVPNTLISNINGNKPVYLSGQHYNSSGQNDYSHAVCLRGYSASSQGNIWSFMDPNTGYTTANGSGTKVVFTSMGSTYTVGQYVTVQ